jgi:DNA-binding GntR family transcriptional regulator
MPGRRETRRNVQGRLRATESPGLRATPSRISYLRYQDNVQGPAPVIAPIDQPKSLTELAVTRLRDAIVEGDLALGERISEASLAAALGISKTPVREALARLRTEGLVTISPRRGTVVFMVSAAEVRAISELRLTLETTALSLAVARSRQAFVTDLGAVVEKMTAARARGDDREYLRLDAAFHEQFFRHCDNGYLADAYRLIAAKIAALRTHLSVRPLQIEDSFDEHRAILEAATEGRTERAIGVLDHQIARMVRAFADDDAGVGERPQRRDLEPLERTSLVDLPRPN